MKMTSNKPYIIRAIYEWIVDNELTPYIVINAEVEGVQVPRSYVEDDNIVLDISPGACIGLHLGNDRIVFSASFSGVATQIYTPPEAVIAIYAKENGEGMVFTFDQVHAEDDDLDGENKLVKAKEPSARDEKAFAADAKKTDKNIGKPAKKNKRKANFLKVVK